MNIKFIIISVLLILPLSIFFIGIDSLREENHKGDYTFHYNNRGQENYPPATSIILNNLETLFPRKASIYITGLLVFLTLPYILIHMITKNITVGAFYLYFSGITFALFNTWFIPQALIHLLILFSMYSNYGVVLMTLTGSLIHREWFLALILIIAVKSSGGIYEYIRKVWES